MPAPVDYSHKILARLADLRKNDPANYGFLRPDSKSQVSIRYENGNPVAVTTVVVSHQHTEEMKREQLEEIVKKVVEEVIPAELLQEDIVYHVNPTGRFVVGGPHGDCGLTGRKIIVDTYGGKGAHGGGAFSGKDPSKVDRSAAYATRHIAKNICAAGLANEALVQVSYAIGVSEPVGLFVNTFGSSNVNLKDSEISDFIIKNIDLTPFGIEDRLKLRKPIYSETSSYGHMGKDYRSIKKKFYDKNSVSKSIDVDLFTWEKLDLVDKLKRGLL